MAYLSDKARLPLHIKVSYSGRGGRFETISAFSAGQNFVLVSLFFAIDSELGRASANIADDHRDEYALLRIRKGVLRIDTDAKPVTLAEGQGMLIDLRDPARSNAAAGTVLDVALFGRRWLFSRMPAIDTVLAQAIDLREGWAAPLDAVLTRIVTAPPSDPAFPKGVLADHVASALVLAFAGRDAGLVGARAATHRRLHRALRAALHDPRLNPGSFARSQGMAVRTLHAVFASAGTTFGETLLHLRLEQARRMLEDPRHDALSIAEIAFLSGFSNASHFGRRFREIHALSPAAWRAARSRRTADETATVA
jgi:AraC-like DNA-binding protein